MLTDGERKLLDALLLDSSARARRRSRIVLDWASGKEIETIARELPTRRARAELVVNAFLENRLDIFSASALKRVAATPPQPKPTLKSQLSMREAARLILSRQFDKLTQCEAGVRQAEDPEAVHDMRVACRRLNSALRLFRNYLPSRPVKRLRPTLEKLRDSLGAARNLDVLLNDLETYSASRPDEESVQLQAVAQAWQTDRARHQQALVKLLDSPSYQKWTARMQAFLGEPSVEASPQVANVVPALLWKQYGAVRAYDTRLATASLAELHALRIEIKRLRYTLEFFRDAFQSPDALQSPDAFQSPDASQVDDPHSPLAPPVKPKSNRNAAEGLIEPLVALQDQLGSIQDAVVAGAALTDFIISQALVAKERGAALPEFQAVANYHSQLNTRIEDLRIQVPECWNVVLGYPFRRQLARLTAML